MKKQKVYIVVALPDNSTPKILGVFRKKSDAEERAYTPENGCWCNIIEKELR